MADQGPGYRSDRGRRQDRFAPTGKPPKKDGPGPGYPGDQDKPGGDEPKPGKKKLPEWFADWVQEHKKQLVGPDSGTLATPGLRKLLRTLAENGATRAQLNAFANAGAGDVASLTGPGGNFNSLAKYLADNPGAIKDVAKWLNKNTVGPTGQGGTTTVQNDAFNSIPGLKDYYTAQFGGIVAPPGSPFAGQLVDAVTGLPSGLDLTYFQDHFSQLPPEFLARYQEMYDSGQMRGNMLAAYRIFTGVGNAIALPGEEGYVSTEQAFTDAGLAVPGTPEWDAVQGPGGPFSQEYYNATSSAYGTGMNFNMPSFEQQPVAPPQQTGPPAQAGPSYIGGFDVPYFEQDDLVQSL